MAKKSTKPAVSVKIEADALARLKAWCEARGLKLTWALSRAADRFRWEEKRP